MRAYLDDVRNSFFEYSLYDWWDTLLLAYSEMGFTDTISDETRIAEFTRILSLYHSFLRKVEKRIAPVIATKPEEALAMLDKLADKATVTDRVTLVYVQLRSNWLQKFHAQLEAIINDMVGTTDDGKDLEDGYINDFEF